ncbi:unnamed protein product [Parnassius apollo]|uniref:(apollo) hypothetical protein n=1 Tax=Parnassius apollo TaxID=110799 RepID=A0A8S3XL01_PARAO|nr:unnamed protein product [Parnassius apollo]
MTSSRRDYRFASNDIVEALCDDEDSDVESCVEEEIEEKEEGVENMPMNVPRLEPEQTSIPERARRAVRGQRNQRGRTALSSTLERSSRSTTNLKEMDEPIGWTYTPREQPLENPVFKQKETLDSYWSTREIIHTPYASKIMTRARFRAIYSCLHLNDNSKHIARGQPNYDAFFKLRPYFDELSKLCKESFYPGEELTINEGTCGFRGESISEFNKDKPDKDGMKIYMLCDTETGYILRMIPYVGDSKTVTQIVTELNESYFDKWHTVYMDRYFTSPTVADLFWLRNTRIVGTVTHEMAFFHCGNLTALARATVNAYIIYNKSRTQARRPKFSQFLNTCGDALLENVRSAGADSAAGPSHGPHPTAKSTRSRKMRDGDIEGLLRRLEKGNISDDEEDIGNENDIDYYLNVQDILNELDIDNDNEEVDEDTPLVSEEEPTESAESSTDQLLQCLHLLYQYRRYRALQLDSRVISLISTWISPVIITEEDYICEACFDVSMQSINAQIHGNNECHPSACSSRLGHTQVCPVCGRSLLNRQSDHIQKENPSSLTLRMINLIRATVAPRQISQYDRVCHACWLRFKRQALLTQQQDERRGLEGDETPHGQEEVEQPVDAVHVPELQPPPFLASTDERDSSVESVAAPEVHSLQSQTQQSSKDQEANEEGLGYRVVMKLGRNLPRNTHLVFDNFFSSLSLMEALYHRGILATGTVRMNRKGLSKDLCPTRPNTPEDRRQAKENKLDLGEFTYRFCHPCTVVKWQDTKEVFVVTTAVNPTKVEVIQKTQKNGQKKDMFCPTAIAEYKRSMGGVDHLDHYRSSYSIGRRSKSPGSGCFGSCLRVPL